MSILPPPQQASLFDVPAKKASAKLYPMHAPKTVLRVEEPPAHYKSFRQVKTQTVKACEPASNTQPGGKTSRAISNKNKKTPSLTLSGQWLKQAGFSVGTSCQIEVFDNMLIITANQADQ